MWGLGFCAWFFRAGPAAARKRWKAGQEQQGSSKITCGHRNNKAKGGKSDTPVEVVRALMAPYRR